MFRLIRWPGYQSDQKTTVKNEVAEMTDSEFDVMMNSIADSVEVEKSYALAA